MPEEKNKDQEIKFRFLTPEHLINEKNADIKKINIFSSDEKEKINIQEIKKEDINKSFDLSEQKLSPQEKDTNLSSFKEENINLQDLNFFYYKKQPERNLNSNELLSPSSSELKNNQKISENSFLINQNTDNQLYPSQKEIINESKNSENIDFSIIEDKEIIIQNNTNLTSKTDSSKKLNKILNYFLITTTTLVLTFLMIFLKPFEKIKIPYLQKPTQKQSLNINYTPETTTVILLPQIDTNLTKKEENYETLNLITTTTSTSTDTKTTTTTTTSTSTSTSTSITTSTSTSTSTIITTTSTKTNTTTTKIISTSTKTSITTTTTYKPTTTKETTFTFPTKDLTFVKFLPKTEVKLSSLNFDEFKKQLNLFLQKQQNADTLVYLKFTFQNQNIPFDFIFDYFIKPTKIQQQKINEFKNEFTGNFAFMIYYTYTRKYPILIFEIKDPLKINEFNKNWEKINMINDLKSLFFELNPGKTLNNNFTNKKFNNIDYRVIYFENNYQILWSTNSNFLIYSSSENGFKKITPYLK